MHNKDKKLFVVLGIFALVIVTTVASFAFFTYSRTGTTKATITSGDIEFSYIEGSAATIINAFPVADSVGAIDTNGEYTFTVKMKSSSTAYKLPYNVSLVDSNNGSDNYFKNNQIKFALLRSVDGGDFGYVAETSEIEGRKLSSVAGFEENLFIGEGTVIENQEIGNGSVHNYKLRIWISDDVVYSNTVDGQDEQESIGRYNGYTYSLKVKVFTGTATQSTNQAAEVSYSPPAGLSPNNCEDVSCSLNELNEMINK